MLDLKGHRFSCGMWYRQHMMHMVYTRMDLNEEMFFSDMVTSTSP